MNREASINSQNEHVENLYKIKYWIIDVDGTMTDGGIYYDNFGNEIKKFSVKDAAGIFAAHSAQMRIIVLTGRECEATKKRMNDLHIDFYYQNVKDKFNFLEQFMQENKISKDELAYIGDDFNDYDAMKLTGFIACPADACDEIQKLSNYISNKNGGYGAVRDIISYVLKARNEWDESIKIAYHLQSNS